MICARCGETTSETPCNACGEEPRLEGRWELLEVLGRGASGVTFRARDQGSEVAVKELALGRVDAKTKELYEREARVLSELQHAQIPRYLESFTAGSGPGKALYLVQELVEGQDLGRWMDSHRCSEDEVLDLLLELVPVLSYLHGRSPPVVHRDLKPQNVLKGPGGLKLIDFGSVRDALKEHGGSTVAGTFGYMAPEAFGGDASPATDVYALGALAVALLTRRDPQSLLGVDRRLHWEHHASVRPGTIELISAMLSDAPEARPTVGELPGRVDRIRNPVTALEPREAAPAVPTEGKLWVELEGEPDPGDYGRIASILERELEMSGSASVVGNTLRWRCTGGRVIEARIEPHRGRTTVRMTEHHHGLVGGLYGGLVGGGGGGLGGGLAAAAFMLGGPWAAVVWVVGCVGGSAALATWLYRRAKRSRAESLARVFPILVAAVEESIRR